MSAAVPGPFGAAPDPVARYLARCLGAHTRLLREVTLRQEGELRTHVAARRWHRFTATERIRPRDIAFAWDARVRLLAGVHLHVRDGYEAGRGRGCVAFGPVPLSREEGTGPLSKASLQRFLAEAPWFPTLLVPSPALRWRAVAHDRALAALTDHAREVEVEFRFDEAGEAVAVYASSRPCRTRRGYEDRAWEGRFAGYAPVEGGLRIPHEAEVGWYVDGTWTSVWRARLSSVDLAFAT